MNAFKRFMMGFVLGIGIMYWYLHYAEGTKSDTFSWFNGAASNYRGDSKQKAAKDILGER
jgi:hypothetical protein